MRHSMTTPKIILSDFDGTLTHHTEMSSELFDILNLAESKKIPFVIVTGRSISWAHFLITHFSTLPIVISEGGGALSWRDKNGLIQNEFLVPESELAKLEAFCVKLKEKYPNLNLTSDSLGRVSDRAIELCDLEDEKFKNEICHLMDEEGINYSTSNVHLNFWCGNLSKANATKVLFNKFFSHLNMEEESIYFGDSLNDQSMFDKVKTSIGVSNIDSVMDRLSVKPHIILKGKENAGPSGVLNYLKNNL
ncbi:HAD family phosphatase [Halobacteriovorax vibrionivorans]|uniref:HAD family phosphatase n=2 Tax=Halobacteriovoraceae TaxID=1652132 RepID=A0ABY0III8_9BACT|nr:HAD family phosphatase [Halobacteriovorax vibrionivorans]TGD45967.1 HAD family phosphatase [Halobacteriovorax sp. Y22]